MTHSQYPSDVSDIEWDAIRGVISAPGGGRPRTYDLRDVVDAVLYVQRTGCPWRLMPHDLPPWRTVHYHLRRWTETGAWSQVTMQLQAHKHPISAGASRGKMPHTPAGQQPSRRRRQQAPMRNATPPHGAIAQD